MGDRSCVAKRRQLKTDDPKQPSLLEKKKNIRPINQAERKAFLFVYSGDLGPAIGRLRVFGTHGHISARWGNPPQGPAMAELCCCNMKTAMMLLDFALRPESIRWYAVWSWSGQLHISGSLRNVSTAPA
jgi:hypothetical protein